MKGFITALCTGAFVSLMSLSVPAFAEDVCGFATRVHGPFDLSVSPGTDLVPTP